MVFFGGRKSISCGPSHVAPVSGTCAGASSGQDDEAGRFFVVAGEVIKVVFLREDVGLRGFFAASEAPEKDRGIDLSGELGAARGVDAIGFALAAFLGVGRWRGTDGT